MTAPARRTRRSRSPCCCAALSKRRPRQLPSSPPTASWPAASPPSCAAGASRSTISAGLPLNRTPPGAFLRLVLDLADSALAPVALLAALKHPLAAGGLMPAVFRDYARRLEARDPRAAPGAGLCRAARGAGRRRCAAAPALSTGSNAASVGLPSFSSRDSVALVELAGAHIRAAELLAASDSETGGSAAVARRGRRSGGAILPRAARRGRGFPGAAGGITTRRCSKRSPPAAVVRPAYGQHPRLAIWGLVEARLQQADLLVLGGLNEGTWPGPAAFDPWMSRQMRHEFGIAAPRARDRHRRP